MESENPFPENISNFHAPAGFDSPEKDITSREKLSRTTGRRLEFYREMFGLNPEDFQGQEILNLGAGNSNLGDDLKQEGIEAVVTNVDIAYKPASDFREKILGKKKISLPERPVAADMARLPFPDNSFDRVLSTFAIAWLPAEKKLAALREALRVIRPAGEVDIYPAEVSVSGEKKLMELGGGGRIKKNKLERKICQKISRDTKNCYL